MSRLVRLSRHPNPATLLTLNKQPQLAFTRCSLPVLTRERTTRYFQCHRSWKSAMLTNVVPTDCHTIRSKYAHYPSPGLIDWSPITHFHSHESSLLGSFRTPRHNLITIPIQLLFKSSECIPSARKVKDGILMTASKCRFESRACEARLASLRSNTRCCSP